MAPGWNKVAGGGTAFPGPGEEATLGATADSSPGQAVPSRYLRQPDSAPKKTKQICLGRTFNLTLFKFKINDDTQSEANARQRVLI